MVVASQTWELALPGCSSLKEKRSVIRSLKDRLQVRFRLSVAETGFQDAPARAEISVALVANGRRLAESVLDKADDFIEANGRAVVIHARREFH
jgi:uncharacterized protein YlxP (DUF503 family)